MRPTSIRNIYLLMILTILLLFGTQVYWFQKSFSLQEQQFDSEINIVLRGVTHQLLLLQQNDSTSIPPIQKIASNAYHVQTKTYFKLATLDSLLKKAFNNTNAINISYDYIITKESNKTIVLGNSVPLIGIPETACLDREEAKIPLDFTLYIKNKTVHLANTMRIWIFSFVSLLVILLVFIFIIIYLRKERKLSVLKKDFVNNMTHELRTPLTNIAVASNAMQKRGKMDTKKVKKYASIIYKENERLQELVDKVLQISLIEKKEESLLFTRIDLHQVLTNVKEGFLPILHSKNGSISLCLHAASSDIKADRIHLTNVIYNLIENAIKYSKEEPQITIATINTNNGVQLEIKDQGIGMDKETQKRIFEKFYRAESGDIHTTKGYGIGLSYVKMIIEKHLGKITFTSIENIGSSFQIYLPQ